MSRKILVVVDMQNDFIDGSLGTDEAKLIVDNVANKIKNFDGEIKITMDTHTKDYLKTQEGKNLPVEHCIKDTDGWKINKKIFESLKGIDYDIYEKPTFGSTELSDDLLFINETEGIESIEFVGLCTGICVISNVLMAKAFLPEVLIKVDSSCCACVNKESHETALNAMKLCQIEVY